MKKHICFIIFAALIILTPMFLPANVCAAENDEISYYDVEVADSNVLKYEIKADGTAVITGADISYKGDLVIPAEIDGFKVTEIGEFAFSIREGISAVIIPEGVTAISEAAFWECTDLSYVKLPRSLEFLGNSCFNNCKNLNEIRIPGSVKNIPPSAFSGCENLFSAVIEEGVVNIGSYAFYQCKNLMNVELPDTVEIIESNGFAECISLKSIKLSKNLEYMDNEAFAKCADLAAIILQNSATTVGYRCFAECDKLTIYGRANSDLHVYSKEWGYNFVPVDVQTEDRVGGFVNEEFVWSLNRQTGELDLVIYGDMQNFEAGKAPWYQYKDEIASFTMHGSCKNIGDYTFYGCGINEITLSPDIKSIEPNAFAGCNDLTKILINNIACKIPENLQINSVQIAGYDGSTAESFALEKGYEFVPVESEHTHVWNEKIYKALLIKDGYCAKVCTMCGKDESYVIKKPFITLPEAEVVYNGKQQKPVFVIKDENGNIIEGVEYTLTLKKGDNYGGAGQKTVGVSIRGLYHVYEEFQYTIKKKSIAGYTVTVKPFASMYMGMPIEATVKVKGLVEGADYSVKFENNINAGTAKVIITGRNNYTGTVKKNFTIKRNTYVDELKIKATEREFIYDGKAKSVKFTITDHGGHLLKEGVDYKVTYPKNGCVKIGAYNVGITFLKNYKGALTDMYRIVIVPKGPSWASAKLSTKSGGYDDVQLSWGKVSKASGYSIYYKKKSAKSYTYYDLTDKTSMTVKNLADGVSYDFKIAPRIPTGAGMTYVGTKNAKIVSAVTLKKVAKPTVVKNGTKVKVSWKNIDGETGYQISRTTSKSGVNVVSTIKTTTGTSATITAAKGTTYYYKVRAYKTVNGEKVFAPWSEPYMFVRK